jgi:hypothetical protein
VRNEAGSLEENCGRDAMIETQTDSEGSLSWQKFWRPRKPVTRSTFQARVELTGQRVTEEGHPTSRQDQSRIQLK